MARDQSDKAFSSTVSGFTGGRKLAFQSVGDYIDNNKLSMDVLLAKIQIKFGMSSTKAAEMINTLLTAGEIEVKDEVVYIRGKAPD